MCDKLVAPAVKQEPVIAELAERVRAEIIPASATTVAPDGRWAAVNGSSVVNPVGRYR